MDEINSVTRELGTFHLDFADDNIFVDKRHFRPLLEALPSARVRWRAQTDVSVTDEESLLDLLYRSGCISLFLGLESLDARGPENLDRGNWKLRQRPRYARAIERIQNHGIGAQAGFIVGLDSDDPSIFDRLIEFIEANRLFSIQVTILTPLPGTRLRERLEKEGRALDTPWINYTGFGVNYVPRGLTPRELP
jgi:radical SAM superfamily enzyme YgiQ (UPF0313 family)